MDLLGIALNLHSAILSNEKPIYYVKFSFALGIGLYVVLLLFSKGNKSFWDIIATKRVLKYLRFFVFIELLCIFYLFYYTIGYGNPLTNVTHSEWQLTRGVSWIYDYPRPIAGFILIGFGMAADMHISIRICCLLGSMLQVVSDCFSAAQVYLYYGEVNEGTAEGGNYTAQDMYNYFVRDLVSICLSITIMLLAVHLTVMLGFSNQQLYPYSLIAGGDFDRCEVMRQQRSLRKSVALPKSGV